MNLGGIILFIKDMQRAIAYYRDIIGLHPDEEQPYSADSFFRLTPDNVNSVSTKRVSRTAEDRRLFFMLKMSMMYIET